MQPDIQAGTHTQRKFQFPSCCSDTIQQKQVSLVSFNYQKKSSCWILALFYSWWRCASYVLDKPLCAMFNIHLFVVRSIMDFRLLSIKTFFFNSDFFFLLWYRCPATLTTANTFPLTFFLFVFLSHTPIKSHLVFNWRKKIQRELELLPCSFMPLHINQQFEYGCWSKEARISKTCMSNVWKVSLPVPELGC